MKMTEEDRDSPCDNREQKNLVEVEYTSDTNSDSRSYSELSNMESPSRLSPLEADANEESSSPFAQLKMKRMLDTYFVPIPHDASLSPVTCSTAISSNGPSAFTIVKSSPEEELSNNTDIKPFNLIKLNQIKSAFAKSGSYSNAGSASSSPVSIGHLYALKKRIKRETFNGDDEPHGTDFDQFISSSRGGVPLHIKEEVEDPDSLDNSESFKVSFHVVIHVDYKILS